MAASTLVQAVIQAAGGLERFEKVASIAVRFSFTGSTLLLKGRRPGHFTVNAVISTKEQKTVLTGLGGSSDEQWVFTTSKVWKQHIGDGAILEERRSPREAFAGHTLQTHWDDLHFTYFVGYALWQYFNFPYLLARPAFQAKEIATHEENGQTWRVLEVQFPEQSGLASHCHVQRYYFDSHFVLQRHGYTADIVARGRPAAHYSYDDVVVNGLSFPTVRRVLASTPVEGGGAEAPMFHGPAPTSFHLVFYRIEVRGEEDKQQGLWTLEGY